MWEVSLRAARQAAWAGGAWQPADDGLADPGWMLPLAVFAHVYANHMVVTTFEEMFERQRPLPLAELHPAGPSQARPPAPQRDGL